MNILAEFNNRVRDNDYAGAAKFLRTIRFQDKTRNDALDQQAAALERYGGITQAILNNSVDPNKRNLLGFAISRHAGNYGAINKNTGRRENPYANKYIDYINGIGNKDNAYAQTLEITFDNDAAYNKFIDESGLTFGNKTDDNQKSPYQKVSNGKRVVVITLHP